MCFSTTCLPSKDSWGLVEPTGGHAAGRQGGGYGSEESVRARVGCHAVSHSARCAWSGGKALHHAGAGLLG
jgi:hypothetical protein